MANNSGEPSSAPQPERWYNLSLGSSFVDQSSSKFYTLRYEFKPASIDKSKAGSLHKNKENRVTVEFDNNQPGKPKVSFEGSSEDYKDNDGVLFFDGQTFRLERLHRAVKRLRHIRLPGESSTAANVSSSASAGAGMDSRSPPVGKNSKPQTLSKPIAHSVPVEIERIDIGEPESPGPKLTSQNTDPQPPPINSVSFSPDPKPDEPEENVDIVVDDDDVGSPNKNLAETHAAIFGFDLNSDDEVPNVDISDDDANKGPTAAEALQAQSNMEEAQQQQQQQQTSSSSTDSGSGSSGSGSGSSSSSDSDGSDDNSASSGGDIDI